MGAMVLMGKWTGENHDHHCHPHPHPRYNSEGNFLGSLPDLITAREYHACSTFTSAGEEVLSAHLINVVFQNRKGSNVVSFLLQTGLAGCWRLGVSEHVIKHRDIFALKEQVD